MQIFNNPSTTISLYDIIETMKDHITKLIEKALQKLKISVEEIPVANPTHESFGDYSSSIAMQLAKKMKKNPLEVAQEIVDNLPPSEEIEKVDVVKPGFINFWVSKEVLVNEAYNILEQAADYGKSDLHTDKKIIVEFSSPNIAKPFTIGHLRSTIIGHAVANLLEATGYIVYRDNHIGDWGTQFGKQIYALHNFGEGNLKANIQKIDKSKNPVKELVALYVEFHEKAEANPELEEEGRKWFKKLENADTEARELWQKCIEWSWKEFEKIYKELDVSFTENNGRGYGESYFEDKMQLVLEELEKHDFYKESKGAKLVFFEDDKYPPLMIIKQDGATLYSTRDLATDKFRLTNPRYRHPELDSGSKDDITIINEVGIEQSLYFQQLYETEKMLGWVEEGQRIHLKHGMYRFKDQKMSTRKGNVIWLEDVLKEATQRAFSLGNHASKFEETSVTTISHKHSDSAKKHVMGFGTRSNVAEAVGIGAIKWNDLKRSSHLDVVFDWEEILNMQGNSGPYIQYTFVRCLSVLKNDTNEMNEIDVSVMNEDERTILSQLLKFPEVIQNAASNLAPHTVTTYLFDLAQKYNLFYTKHQILKAEDNKKAVRLLITRTTAQVLKNGLHLLGIKTVEKM